MATGHPAWTHRQGKSRPAAGGAYAPEYCELRQRSLWRLDVAQIAYLQISPITLRQEEHGFHGGLGWVMCCAHLSLTPHLKVEVWVCSKSNQASAPANPVKKISSPRISAAINFFFTAHVLLVRVRAKYKLARTVRLLDCGRTPMVGECARKSVVNVV